MGLSRSLAIGIKWFEQRILVYVLVCAFGLVTYRGDVGLGGWPGLAITLAITFLLTHRLILVYRIRSRFSPAGSASGVTSEFLQLDLLLVCGVFLLIQLTGWVSSPLYPLAFVLLAAVGGLEQSRRNIGLTLGVAWALEILPLAALVRTGAEPREIWTSNGWTVLSHLGGLLLFTAVGRILVAGLAGHLRLKARREAREREQQHLDELVQRDRDARQYRIRGSVADLKGQGRSEEKRERSSLNSLKQRVHSLLVILYEALRPETVAFFLLSRDEQTVLMMGGVSKSMDDLVTDPLPAGRGVIGAILKNQDTVSFNHVREDPDRFNYYQGKKGLKTFIGVPLLETHGNAVQVRGVLLADRKADVAFGRDDESLLKAAANELLHSIHTERALSRTEKLGGLLEASEGFNRALNLAEVVDEVLDQVLNVYPEADFTAIALIEGPRTYLAGVKTGPEFAAWREQHVQSDIEDDSLCSQAIQTCSVLPQLPFHKRSRSQRQAFGKSLGIDGLRSLKCLPLKVAGTEGRKSQPGEEKAIGALVVASHREGMFPEEQEELASMLGLLGLLVNMAAISIQNAQRWEQLERMATTDGLTGLHNHRRFKEMLDEAVAESLRYDRSLSMILSDIDHFKSVNDTYGHPMGDEVLKRVARVLAELARESDKVCRYGGEEFSVILPETDRNGARMLAERFREKIKEQSFTHEGTQFGVTLSLGICTLPDFARHRQELIDRADQALYHAKNNGRNRSVHYSEIASKAASGA